ncbi:MAG: Zn-binding domain-containing protein, partial [Gammaproteobacteria bacterium]
NGKEQALDGDQFHPTVFLYDNYPGGIGLSAPLYDLRERIVTEAQEMVKACACKHGCPLCVGPILATEQQRGHSPKTAAVTVLERLAGKDAGFH